MGARYRLSDGGSCNILKSLWYTHSCAALRSALRTAALRSALRGRAARRCGVRGPAGAAWHAPLALSFSRARSSKPTPDPQPPGADIAQLFLAAKCKSQRIYTKSPKRSGDERPSLLLVVPLVQQILDARADDGNVHRAVAQPAARPKPLGARSG